MGWFAKDFYNNNNNNYYYCYYFAVTKILDPLHHILKCDPCPEQHYFNFWLDSLLRKKLNEELFSGARLFMKGILQFWK